MGEYTNVQNRNLDEIYKLIQSFQFFDAKEPKQLIFSAENSICLEHSNGNFIKIMSFQLDHYHIWYYETSTFLWKKLSVIGSENLNHLVAYFYKVGTIEKHKFNEMGSEVSKSMLCSFQTQEFVYESKKRIWRFLFVDCFIEIVALVFTIFMFLSLDFHSFAMLPILMVLIVPLSCFIVLINYIIKSKNYKLILSKGGTAFYFGVNDNLQKFNKNDIRSFEEVGITRMRSLLNQFYYLKITMNDGTNIIIPNLIISELKLMIKFPQLNGITRKKNPIILEKALILKSNI